MSGLMRSSEQKNMRMSALSAMRVSRRWRTLEVSHSTRYTSRRSGERLRKGRPWRLTSEERLKALSIAPTVRLVPGEQRSRYASSWPATLTSVAPGSSAPPCGSSVSAKATSVARCADVKAMSCDYCAAMRVTRRLRLLLRIWAVIFALGAIDFLVFPSVTVRLLNSGASAMHMQGVTVLRGTNDFWLTLAVPYMILVAAFSWVAQRGAKIQAQPIQFLMLAKASS